METMLWVVLVVAFTLAVGMVALAWRLLRGDRQRTDARVAALRHLAFEPTPDPAPPAHDILGWDEPLSTPPVFAAATQAQGSPRHWMPVLVLTVFVALGAGTLYGIYGPDTNPLASIQSLSWNRPAAPLELLSLTHRTDKGDFVVTGLIQNPQAGATTSDVMAVVFAFNDQGEYVASGKSVLEFSSLAPGAESPFVVRIPGLTGVSRFRVGFRTDEGLVVSHVDHRGQPIEGTTAGSN